MKKQIGTLFILLLYVCSFSVNLIARNYEEEKTVTRSFEARKGHTLSVENKYGNLNVQTWNKNEIHFEVTIKVSTNSQSKTDEILSKINIAFGQTGNTVSAKTTIDSYSCNNCSLSINYQVMVPEGINYKVNNKYGNANIPDATGNADLIVEYGNLTTGNLLGSQNNINVKYGNAKSGNFSGTQNLIDVKYGNFDSGNFDGKTNNLDIKYGSIKVLGLMGNTNTVTTSYGGNVSIEQTKDMKIDIKYSNLKIGTANDLDINSGYTNTTIGKAKNIKVISKYENYKIGEVDEIKADAFGYTNVTIDKLGKGIKVNEIKYGKLDINYVAPNFELIEVGAKHTNVRIKFDPKASYNVDLFTKYANISTPSGNINRSEPSRNSVEVKGAVGGNSPKAKVKVINSYGNIDLK